MGQVVRDRRERLGLTQRDLASMVGVQASHIAYIEGGNRRPSLALLARLSDALSLDSHRLFLLLHPDAEQFLDRRSEPPKRESRDAAWREFISNRALLRRNGVTNRELKILRQVSLLRRVKCSRHFMFVLNSIRQAAAEVDEIF